MLDFGEDPIWTEYFDKEEGRLLTGIEKVDNDKELWDINETIQELFTSYYQFDYNDQACFFDEEQEKKDKYKMLALLEKLKKRLYEINDGSFEIDDKETERIKPSILNGLGYIVRLEKKNGNRACFLINGLKSRIVVVEKSGYFTFQTNII